MDLVQGAVAVLYFTCPLHVVMTRRHIPKAVKEQLVVMSGNLKSSDIARVTHISKRTVDRVLKLKQDTGSVVCIPFALGRPRLLNGLDMAVRFLCFTVLNQFDCQSILKVSLSELLIYLYPSYSLSFKKQEGFKYPAKGFEKPSRNGDLPENM
jgi:hypothetical protein